MFSLGSKINQKNTGKNTLKQGQVYKPYLKEETFFLMKKCFQILSLRWQIVKNPKNGDKKRNSQPT